MRCEQLATFTLTLPDPVNPGWFEIGIRVCSEHLDEAMTWLPDGVYASVSGDVCAWQEWRNSHGIE